MEHEKKMLRYTVLLLVLSSFCLASKPDCKAPEDSCGPIPPPLPESYMLAYEEANLQDKTAFWVEDSFDFKNMRMKRKLVSRGHEYHQIADYKTEQVMSYQSTYPGAIPLWDVRDLLSCYAEDIMDPKFIGRFGWRTGEVMAPHRMYTSNLALKYGGPYAFAYNNKSVTSAERAAGIDQFTGCVYDKYEDSTNAMTVSWSGSSVLTASGEMPSLMQIIEDGGRYVTSDSGKKDWVDKKTVKEIVWYLADKDTGDEAYQLPPLMHCKDMRSRRDLPTIPKAFSVRSDMAIWSQEYKGDNSVVYDNTYYFWYDEDMQMARVDIYPSVTGKGSIETIFGVNEPLTAVLDYNTGLAFVVVHRTRECKPQQIRHGFPFMSKYVMETPVMASPGELFEIDSDTVFVYKGQRTVRGILCDIWSANKTSPDAAPGSAVRFAELAFAANDWRSASDEVETMNVPIQMTGLTAQHGSAPDMGMTGSTAVVNYFKFKGTAPPLSTYDIGDCVFHHVQRYFVIQFPGRFRDIILRDQRAFLDTAQFMISIFGDLGSVLRVQQLQYMYSETTGTNSLSFAMLEKLPKVRYSKGLTISEAVQVLTLLIDAEVFVIELQNGTALPGQEPPKVNVTAIPGSFKEVTLPSKSQARHRRSAPELQMSTETDRVVAGPLFSVSHSDGDGENEPSGYTPGAVAGMAIGMLILGLLAGVGGMIFYMRRYG